MAEIGGFHRRQTIGPEERSRISDAFSAGLAAVGSGYHQRNPLSASELDMLFDLIRTRLAMTIIHFYWRLAARGEDDAYLQKQVDSEGGAFEFLQSLSALGPTVFRARISP